MGGIVLYKVEDLVLDPVRECGFGQILVEWACGMGLSVLESVRIGVGRREIFRIRVVAVHN